MTTTDIELTVNYQEVANGASLITLNSGIFVRLHIKALAAIPADNVPFHPFDKEDGSRDFAYGGTERVFARKNANDKLTVILAVTPAV